MYKCFKNAMFMLMNNVEINKDQMVKQSITLAAVKDRLKLLLYLLDQHWSFCFPSISSVHYQRLLLSLTCNNQLDTENLSMYDLLYIVNLKLHYLFEFFNCPPCPSWGWDVQSFNCCRLRGEIWVETYWNVELYM